MRGDTAAGSPKSPSARAADSRTAGEPSLMDLIRGDTATGFPRSPSARVALTFSEAPGPAELSRKTIVGAARVSPSSRRATATVSS